MAKVYRKLTLFGGEGGQAWDDDVYEGVRKVYVGQDNNRITYVKFEYVKENGDVVTRENGKVNQPLKEFVLQYPDEHITAVEGNYSSVFLCATEVITNLLFKTSKGRKSPLFGPNLLGITSGTKFVIEDGGKKIVGFHGRSGDAIDAFGVYFALGSLNTSSSSLLSPVYKLDAQGGTGGRFWDDGSYDGVKSISICQDNSRITYLEFEYEKAGKFETRPHGVKGGTQLKFVLNPDEYIKSVEATYEKPDLFRNTVIRSLKFETSKGRTSFYGYNSGKKFVLEQKGLKVVGFHGKEGSAIDALGAYFAPIHTVIPPKKLPAIGGNGGVSWDDGVYDDVRRILVGQGNDGVAFVKFEYSKGKDLVPGGDHGKKTLLGAEEFKLEDGEYLTAIYGYYDKIFGIEAPIITCLKFKTNKRESNPYGMDSGEKFTLGEKDHKIVGFHGQASDVVHSIGVSLVPVTDESGTRKPNQRYLVL